MGEITAKNSIHLENANERREAALKKIAPNIVENTGSNWQQRKSAQTKYFLLKTTLECLAKHGYSLTTTQLVTQKANISRGALLHHFATKQELIKQVIEFTFYRQMNSFYERIIKLSDQQRVSEIAGLDIYWEFLKTTEYEAYRELFMASRTDKELRNIFEPKDIMFQKIWVTELPFLFPEWQGREEEMLLVNDLIYSSLRGLLLGMHHIRPKARRARLRKLIATITSQILNEEMVLPEISKSDIKNVE